MPREIKIEEDDNLSTLSQSPPLEHQGNIDAQTQPSLPEAMK